MQSDSAKQLRLGVIVSALGWCSEISAPAPSTLSSDRLQSRRPTPGPDIRGSHLRGGVADLLVGDDHRDADLRHVGDAGRHNNGEGGHHGLSSRCCGAGPSPASRRTAAFLAALGIFGAALFFGDSMITRRSRCCRRSRTQRGGSRNARLGGADHRGNHLALFSDAASRHRCRGTALPDR